MEHKFIYMYIYFKAQSLKSTIRTIRTIRTLGLRVNHHDCLSSIDAEAAESTKKKSAHQSESWIIKHFSFYGFIFLNRRKKMKPGNLRVPNLSDIRKPRKPTETKKNH
jgi:hypothetical protein